MSGHFARATHSFMTKPNNLNAISIPYFMLYKTASLPIEKPTMWYEVKGIFFYLVTVTLMITMIMECYHISSNFIKLSEMLYVNVNVVAFIIKYTCFTFVQRSRFVYTMGILQGTMFLTYPDDLCDMVRDRTAAIQNITKLFRSFSFIYVISIASYPLFGYQNLPFQFSYELGWFMPGMYVYQVFALAVSVWVDLSLDSLCSSTIGSATIQLEILAEKIVRIRDDYNKKREGEIVEFVDEVVMMRLKQCVVHHQTIIEYVESIDAVFSFSALTQFVASGFVICITLFNAVVVKSSIPQTCVMISFLIVVLIELFIYCWFGHNLLLKSTAVGDACYTLNWYNCGNSVRKYLFIIMERSNRPLKVTAYKFSVLSLTAFSAIMRWAYSYFALLGKLYQRYTESHRL